MPRALPSTSALLAFDAIARHQSFTRAATELNLTQTAISHRIKELENQLAVQLFTRKNNATRLTHEGRAYLESIRPALMQIASATESLSATQDNRLTIACLVAFASKRLTPALHLFRAQHPHIELRLTPLAPTDRIDQREFDVAIWHGTDDWPNFDANLIAAQDIFPVCTPQLLASGPALDSPDDLRHYPIVRTVSPIVSDDWAVWLKHAGADMPVFNTEIYCETLSFSMNAITEGLGVGIGRSILVRDDLASGRLVAPFPQRCSSHAGYYLLSRPEKSRLSRVQAFRAWLLDHFAAG